MQHLFGPQTFAAYQAAAFEDHCIKQIWNTLSQPRFAGNSALFVVSDHGFAPYDKFIQPNVVLKRLGLVEADARGGVTRRQAWAVATGGSAFLYLFDDKAKAHSAEIVRSLKHVEGVESILEPAEFTKARPPRSE